MTKPQALIQHDAHVRAREQFARWWLGIRTRQDGDCLIWLGCTDSHGGPVAHIHMQHIHVRRWFYEATVGPLAQGWHVISSCGDQRCCAHLQAMSKAEHNGWLAKHKRFSTPRLIAARRRTGQARRIYTDEQVAEVRGLLAQGLDHRAISERTGIARQRISEWGRGVARTAHIRGASVFNLGGIAA